MSIFMLVGIFGTLISKEPKIKREKNLKNHHHARFFLTVVMSVACFIYSYSKLNNPFSEDQILFGFIFAISRIVLSNHYILGVQLLILKLKVKTKLNLRQSSSIDSATFSRMKKLNLKAKSLLNWSIYTFLTGAGLSMSASVMLLLVVLILAF